MFIEAIRINHNAFPNTGGYPFNLDVFRKTDRLNFGHPVSFFVGENGSGKSTLLEAISRRYGLTIWGGEKTHISHRNPYETRLYDFLSIESRHPLRNIERGFLFRAESFFNYASYLDDLTMYDPAILRYYGGKSFNQQSHGEAFLSFLSHRCKMEGLYLMDEPEAALSPANQLAFLKILWSIVQEGPVQFVISTHSPIILGYPGAQIFSFDHSPIKQIAYEKTNSYIFYKGFMRDRSKYLESFPGVDRKKEGDDGQGQGELRV